MRKTAVCVFLGLLGGYLVTPAYADMRCVQTELARLGYDPGPADGLIGNRTRSAASAFVADAEQLLPELSGESAVAWCEVLRVEPSPPLDVTSPPKDVLSDSDLQRLWNAYKSAGECMGHRNIGDPSPIVLSERSAEDFGAMAWHSPFTAVRGAAQCSVDAGGLVPPAPIPVVTLDERYGERVGDVDLAGQWFARIATYIRLTDDPVAHAVLKRGILDWAQAGSLTKGVRISRDERPIDFQMMQTIMILLNATAEIAADFEPAERAVVGPWLQNIVGQVADSTWRFRQDNKPYLRTYVALIWGLMSNDELAVRQAVEVYKQAIHEMRPDGSWPIDSQRGGMGLHYGARSTSSLGLIALALQSARGLDLFSYEVDGRSIHTAVDFVVSAMQDPGKVNQQYALTCPGGGDRFGSIEEPDLYLFEDGGFFSAYAAQFSDREASRYLAGAYPLDKQVDYEIAGGRASCQFALAGGSVSLPALEMPDLGAVWPIAEYAVRNHEEISATAGRDERLDVLWFTDVIGVREGSDPLRYNLVGTYDAASSQFMSFRIATKARLDASVVAKLGACGAKTENYDGANHPVVEFTLDTDVYVPRKLDCVLASLPEREAFEVAFLVDHFQDVALGWASTGDDVRIKHDGLRELILAVARGETVFQRPAQSDSTDAEAWPTAMHIVQTREEISATAGQAAQLDVLWFSDVIGLREGDDPLRYNLLGDYSPITKQFVRFRLSTKTTVDESVHDALIACGGKTDFYDDAHHPVLEFRMSGSVLKGRAVDCVLGNLPERQALEVSFLLDNFQDVALGWASTGDLAQIQHEGLRELIRAIAKGEITVSR